MAPSCIAYKEDGTLCREPATQLDRQRGGMVCQAHAPKRPFGLCAGEFTVPADFDDPLPEDILRDFEGEA
jgi:hypothetical protein